MCQQTLLPIVIATDLQATLSTYITDKHLTYRMFCAAAVHQALPWSLLRFAFLGLVGVVSHKVSHPCHYPVDANGTCTKSPADISLQSASYSSPEAEPICKRLAAVLHWSAQEHGVVLAAPTLSHTADLSAMACAQNQISMFSTNGRQ